MGNEPIMEQTHAACRDGIDRQIKAVADTVKKNDDTTIFRLNAHAVDLKAMEALTSRIAALQESSVKRIITLEEEAKIDRAANEERFRALEETQAVQKAKPNFWETDNGKLIVKVGAIAALLIIAAAIGVNAVDALGWLK